MPDEAAIWEQVAYDPTLRAALRRWRGEVKLERLIKEIEAHYL